MARIIGALGSEKVLIQELHNLGIGSLQSISQVEDHLKNSDSMNENLKDTERARVREEIEMMKIKHREFMDNRTQQCAERLELLTKERDTLRKKQGEPEEETWNPFKIVIQKYRRWRDTRRLRVLEEQFWEEVDRPLTELANQILHLERRIRYLENNVEEEVLRRLAPRITEKERIDRALEHVRSWVIGARGERDVVLALAELPDTFVIINDVVLRLDPPMKTPQGLRFQCQADHVVVGPPGVFNIETKYWSQESVQSLDLRSPVEQIRQQRAP
jgi:hypothetical protein